MLLGRENSLLVPGAQTLRVCTSLTQHAHKLGRLDGSYSWNRDSVTDITLVVIQVRGNMFITHAP